MVCEGGFSKKSAFVNEHCLFGQVFSDYIEHLVDKLEVMEGQSDGLFKRRHFNHFLRTREEGVINLEKKYPYVFYGYSLRIIASFVWITNYVINRIP